MKDIEERLRDAFEHQASMITEESLRPPRWPPTTEPAVTTSRWSTARHKRWVVPVAAASAIVAVTIGISLVLGARDPQTGPAHGGSPTVTPPSPTPALLLEKGRHYDVANIIGSTHVQGSAGGSTLVLHLHRLRVHDGQTGTLIPDRQIASRGFTPYPHTDQIEVQKDQTTYQVRVRPAATFVINECTGNADGVPTSLRAHHVTAAAFLRSYEKVSTVLELDARGRLISAQTDGGC